MLYQPIFPLSIKKADTLFPGFAEGDFALIYGASSSLTSLLCVRAQLPKQLGGLESNVIFIDGGGITFRLYKIAKTAQIYQLNPKRVLDNIYISRAFTAYQEIFLIMQQLQQATKKYSAKLVIISDIAGLFLDNIAEEEAQRVFSQLMGYLSNFAKENRLILIATYHPHEKSKRNTSLQGLAHAKANVILSFKHTNYGKTISLDKHPYLNLGSAELYSENPTLTDFMGEKA